MATWFNDAMEEAARIAVEAEREACAEVAEDYAARFAAEANPLYRQIAEDIATRIRERGEQ